MGTEPCVRCDGTGWRPIDDPSGVRRVERCDCWREQLGRQRLADADIHLRYRHCTLENFNAYNETLVRGVGHARRLIEEFPVVQAGLFFEGQAGVGKTHLAVAILKGVIERTGCVGLFKRTRDLLKVIKNSYNPSTKTTELEVLRPVFEAQLLVLDESLSQLRSAV